MGNLSRKVKSDLNLNLVFTCEIVAPLARYLCEINQRRILSLLFQLTQYANKFHKVNRKIW